LPQTDFGGVDKDTTILYIAAIYYLCGYPAVANVYIRRCDHSLLKSEAAMRIWAIVSGNDARNTAGINLMLGDNDGTVYQQIKSETRAKNSDFQYASVYDFFESRLLEIVMERFATDNLRSDLYRYDPNTDWSDYIRYAISRHIYSFLPSQREAFERGLLAFKRSFGLHMPTSAGKSFITELLIYQELRGNTNAKVLYLAPLRSLSHELKLKYAQVSKALGFTFRCIYGGGNFSVSETFVDDADMLISTPEAFMGLEGAIDDILSRFTLVICDEGQLLVSEGRGLEYELLLSRMLKQDGIRFLFISAIVPNVGEINTWLGGESSEVCSSNYRPIDLRFGFYQQTDSGIDVNVQIPRHKTEVELHSFVPNVKFKSVKDRACSIALQALNAGSVMLYTSFKGGNSSCEKYGWSVKSAIDRQQHTSPSHFLSARQTERLHIYHQYAEFLFGKDYYQTVFLHHGYAVHHGSVPQCMREIIETAFSRGEIKMVICNKTLAEGVNFPVKTLVLGDIRSPKGKGGFMPLDDLMNVIGRAGRAGKETYGMVIGSADNDRYILKAAKGDGLQPAKGQMSGLLEDIARAERAKGHELTDDEMKELLEATGYAESLDKMIMLSTDDFSFQNANAEALASSSLTYHLTSNQGQSNLRRVFNSRFKNLQGLSSDLFDTYKQTGISPKEIEGISSRIHDNIGWDSIEVEDLCESNFIDTMLQLAGFGETEDKGRQYAVVLRKWMRGFTYKEIADEVGLSVDNTVDCIERLTRDFLMESKAVIRYVCYRFDVENEAFGYWPIFVEKGLCTNVQAILCRKGLSDRIALHIVDRYIREETNWQILGESLLRDLLLGLLRGKRLELNRFLERSGIPMLVIERVNEFLGTGYGK
ncbi:MAG: DEAD/DEAH box helicase, partial [Bacteroidales bacterium]|nr:DEAD/DEAH box helicase [Bacteroidales bacterium]